MIDKLYLRTEELATTTPSLFRMSASRDRLYECCIRLSWRPDGSSVDHVAFVKMSPTHSSKFRTRIELNPSNLSSLNEIKWLTEALGLRAEGLEVIRIDHCADLEVQLQTVLRGLFVPRKRCATEFSNAMPTGAHYGRRPEQLTAYTKSSTPRQHLTRLELRQWNRRCAAKTFLELEELVSYDPFSALKHYRPKDPLDINSRQQEHLSRLVIQLETSGFHAVTAGSRVQRNFKRDFLPLFVETDLVQTATKLYQDNVQLFLSGQWLPPTSPPTVRETVDIHL